MNIVTRLLLLLTVAFMSGCATVVPQSWKEPIAPTMSRHYEVERPWEALAVHYAEGKIFSVEIPEKWYRTQFPFVPVKEPESKEIVPLQRMVSRTVLFCNSKWIRSSAVINHNSYDVLIPQSCKEGDPGVIISGDGKQFLTFSSEIVSDRDVQMKSLLGDTRYREQFFNSHPSSIRNVRFDVSFPPDEQFDRETLVIDGNRFRINSKALLAMMITVGSNIEERFLDCGGGNINVVSAVLVPISVVIKGGFAFFCAAIGEPKGLFVPDGNRTSTTSEERNSES